MESRRKPLSQDVLGGIQTIVNSLREVSVSLDVNETLEAILDGAQSLFPYNAAAIYVVRPDSRELVASAERGYPETSSTRPSSRKPRDVLNRVFRHGRSLTENVANEPTYIERRQSTRTEVVVPILGSGRRIVGALILESDVDGTYASGASHFLELFGSAVAGAVERAVLHSQILHARRLEQELEFGRRVMNGLLPQRTPTISGIQMSARIEPQLDVGGDYYDFIPIDGERWGVVIADVVGKGVAAALLMSTLRASLHSLAQSELALRSTLKKANRFFRESAEEGKYATVFYGELDVTNRRLMYINAGHLPPMVIRKDGRVDRLETGGAPLGLFGHSQYVEGLTELEPGDLVVLYTDGVTEAHDPNDAFYGENRLIAALEATRHRDPGDICRHVREDVERFRQGTELNDDWTLVVLKVCES